jgi:hypothetical protein
MLFWACVVDEEFYINIYLFFIPNVDSSLEKKGTIRTYTLPEELISVMFSMDEFR